MKLATPPRDPPPYHPTLPEPPNPNNRVYYLLDFLVDAQVERLHFGQRIFLLAPANQKLSHFEVTMLTAANAVSIFWAAISQADIIVEL